MHKDGVIQMAHEAGASSPLHCTIQLEDAGIIRFAALVRNAALDEAGAVVQGNADACEPGSLLQVYLASNAAALRALKTEEVHVTAPVPRFPSTTPPTEQRQSAEILASSLIRKDGAC